MTSAPAGPTLRDRLRQHRPVPRIHWGPALLAFVAGLLVGFGWSRPSLGAARDRVAALEDEVAAVRAEAQLATTILAAQAGDTGATLGHGRDFFVKAETAVAREIGGPKRVTGAPPTRAALGDALAERAALLAGLAAGDAATVDRLRAHHEALRVAIRGRIAPGARAAISPDAR
jgi:hypothetical protein